MTKIQNESLIARGGGGFAGVAELLVSAADSTPDFLDAKIAEGQNVATTILNPGADEDLEIAASNVNDIIQVARSTGFAVTNEDIVRVGFPSGLIFGQFPFLADAHKLVTISVAGGVIVIMTTSGSETIDGSPTAAIVSGTSKTFFPFSDEWNLV